MIKKLTIVFSFVLFISYSCKNKVPALKPNTNSLSGKYSVGSFEMTPEYNLEKLNSLGMLNFGKTPFEFSENKLKLSPEIAKYFSGITNFTYEITKEKLILLSESKNFELNYIDDGTFRLSIDSKYFKRLDLKETKP